MDLNFLIVISWSLDSIALALYTMVSKCLSIWRGLVEEIPTPAYIDWFDMTAPP